MKYRVKQRGRSCQIQRRVEAHDLVNDMADRGSFGSILFNLDRPHAKPRFLHHIISMMIDKHSGTRPETAASNRTPLPGMDYCGAELHFGYSMHLWQWHASSVMV
jgi:hypothetical protein